MTGVIEISEFVGLFAAAFFGMEGVAWLAHRYVMHGLLWCWHRSHHEQRGPGLELNDLFAFFFAMPAIACIYLGVHGNLLLVALGLGITAYGAVYFLFHDGLVHRRFAVPLAPDTPFWKPRVQAHHLHHTVKTKDRCVSFGFLWAPPVQRVRQQLRSRPAPARK